MGFGFFESVYKKCLLIELHKSALDTESQKPITVYYEDEKNYHVNPVYPVKKNS